VFEHGIVRIERVNSSLLPTSDRAGLAAAEVVEALAEQTPDPA